MPQVANQDERDRVLWDAWIAGTRQVELAETHGITQQAVSQAINRYRETIPIEDKATAFVRDLERLEELVSVYRPKALAGDLDAAKLIKNLVAQEAKMLGLESPRTIEAILTLGPIPGADLTDRLAEVRRRNAPRTSAARARRTRPAWPTTPPWTAPPSTPSGSTPASPPRGVAATSRPPGPTGGR